MDTENNVTSTIPNEIENASASAPDAIENAPTPTSPPVSDPVEPVENVSGSIDFSLPTAAAEQVATPLSQQPVSDKNKSKKFIISIIIIAFVLIGVSCGMFLPKLLTGKKIKTVEEPNNLFSDGLLLVGDGEKMGYIDKSGKLVIPYKYDKAFQFSQGFAVVYSKEKDAYGLINKKGEQISDYIYDDTGAMYDENGFLSVKSGDKWGIIDKTQTFVVNPTYDYISRFYNGLCSVGNEDKDGNIKLALINIKGEVLTDFEFDTCYVADFEDNDFCRVKVNEKWGTVNRNGKYIIEPKYTIFKCFSEGIAFVCMGDSNEENPNAGFIDKTGKTVIPFDYTKENFDDGGGILNGMILFYSGDKYGYMDATGKMVINPIFAYAENFAENGFAIVTDDKGKVGYIDKTGKYVIEPQFDDAYDFREGIALVCVGEKYGYINEKGEYIINPQFDTGSYFDNGKAIIHKDEKVGVINTKGEYILEPKYAKMSALFDDGYFYAVNEDKKYAVLKSDGTEITKYEFTQLDGNSLFCIEKDCYNYRTVGSEYCYEHEPYSSSGYSGKYCQWDGCNNKATYGNYCAYHFYLMYDYYYG